MPIANQQLGLLGSHVNHRDNDARDRHGPVANRGASRPRTPNVTSRSTCGVSMAGDVVEGEHAGEEDPKMRMFRDLYARSEAQIASLFGQAGDDVAEEDKMEAAVAVEVPTQENTAAEPGPPVAQKPATRTIDEDDYDDYDDEDGGTAAETAPAAKPEAVVPAQPSRQSSSTSIQSVSKSNKRKAESQPIPTSHDPAKTSEAVRKQLHDDRKAAEHAAKRSCHTFIYTLENDRDAMLEQQKLDELDRQVDAEMSNHTGHANNASNAVTGAAQHGKLSNTNLGASSLTLKHLIARIDAKRDRVRASDAELRSLMSEVRKNRSKWASEEKVGQEELYEAAEKVLSELKAMTEHSTAFLTRVNRREAPDYYTVITTPMDLGTMTKKLKSLNYKSKQDFVADLNLIWSNCLQYNADPSHYLRKHALAMRKETDRLVPLIPDIVIRDRADVEAEERRMQNGGVDVDVEGAEESDDEPIMSSRGRKAPGTTSRKGVNTARKAPRTGTEGSHVDETRSSVPRVGTGGSTTNLRGDFLRAGSDVPMDGTTNGLSTPELGAPRGISPSTLNGVGGSTNAGSQAEPMETDGFGNSMSLSLPPGLTGSNEDIEHEDFEYKTWKQVTKKDRAHVAAERHRLFKGDKLNTEEPALLRTRASMRTWLRKQRLFATESTGSEGQTTHECKENAESKEGGATLAEGMEGEEDRMLPDYYDVLGAVPEVPPRVKWVEDANGQLIDQTDEFLRILPPGSFTSPASALAKKMDANMRQMQDTRKICSKIGIIKQMQLQSQMYQNQFQKYDPEPFDERDVDPVVVSDPGAVMAPWVCRAALQRSVAKIFYHAGFEEFQPSALEAITDLAGDFFLRMVQTVGVYQEAPKVAVPAPAEAAADGNVKWKQRFTKEEIILHCLNENGLDVEALDNYVNDDMERLSSKLKVMHERMKAHLTDLLRPALTNPGGDGSEAFNDGSEQFIAGDFAEDIDMDFFGFRELGLDKEFGLSSLSVPLHLLHNRMHTAYNNQNPSVATAATSGLQPPPPPTPVSLESLKNEIKLVQNFFLAKLHANNDEPLIEDEDLPQKQRLPKPRLPPTGKITSPRKRPLKEQGAGKSKKRKVEGKDGEAGGAAAASTATTAGTAGAGVGAGMAAAAPALAGDRPVLGRIPPVGRLKLAVPTTATNTMAGAGPAAERSGSPRPKAKESEKEDGASGVGMMSPESIVAG